MYPFCTLPQDKQELLRQFVTSNENMESVETNLKVSREQIGEIEHVKELLTIKEMRDKGFSQILAIKICTVFLGLSNL